MDDSFRDRLLKAEESFLFAVVSSVDAVSSFNEEWLSLLGECEEYGSLLSQDTVVLAHAISSRMALMAESFLDIQTVTTSLQKSGMDEIDAVFDSHPQDISLLPTKTDTLSPPSPSVWLLQNLHNPYPPAALKVSMERNTTKSVSEWFIKARQRIGWTKLLRDRFNGCRSTALDAAFQAYIRDDPANPLDSKLRSEFMTVRMKAECILAEMTTENDQNGYPDISEKPRSSSPVPSLTFSADTDDSDDDVLSSSPACVGRKRSISQSSEDFWSTPDNPRPSKRHQSYPTICHLADAAPSSQAYLTDSETSPGSTSTIPSRKRRLSENASTQMPKRPRGLEGPRQRAVSDPLHVSVLQTESGDWFDALKLPSLASTDTCNTQSVDSELFNIFSFLGEHHDICSADIFSSHGCHPTPSIVNLPTSADFDLFSLQSSTGSPVEFTWNEFLNLDTFLDVSSLTPSDPSSTPLLDLSGELSLDIPSITLPSTVPITKSVFNLNPMLQAFSDFLSTNVDSAVSILNADNEKSIGESMTYRDINLSQHWLTV